MSLKEKIISAGTKARNTLTPVTAWGEPAFIRVMSGTERDAWESQVVKDGKVDREMFRAKVLVKSLADETGARIFTDEDIAALSALDCRELDRLYTIASKVNGLSKEDEDQLVKN